MFQEGDLQVLSLVPTIVKGLNSNLNFGLGRKVLQDKLLCVVVVGLRLGIANLKVQNCFEERVMGL